MVNVSHVVWDWNGTLLDDLAVVIEAVNVGLATLGREPVDEDEYRDHFTRPVRSFYDSLLDRPVDDMEWSRLNKMFHAEYDRRVAEAPLAGDALAAIDMVAELRWTQSLLSMTPHDRLREIVTARELLDRFVAVDGLHVETGGLKARHLEEHVMTIGLHPRSVVVIGDTPDDATAASHVGARVILYDGGSHHLPHLESAGPPVAHTLTQAVEMAAGLS